MKAFDPEEKFFITPKELSNSTHVYHQYTLKIKNGKRDEFARFLRENGIYTTYRYYPLHRVPGYGVTGDFPNADYAADHTLNLPIHQSITDDDLELIIEKVREFDNLFCK